MGVTLFWSSDSAAGTPCHFPKLEEQLESYNALAFLEDEIYGSSIRLESET